MKKKLLIMLMSLVACVCCFFGIAACDNSEEGSSDWANGIFTVETAYAEAQDLGYSGTLEDFIASISGSNGVGISSVTLNSDGELVITLSDTTTLNLGVIKGADGQDGKDGTDGQDGTDGKDGAAWYNGTYAAMSDVTANEGDYYLTTDTYAVYTYTSGSWTLVITSIKGADGAAGSAGAQGAAGAAGKDGADGATWYTGSGAPEATTGTDGDMYLDTSSYDIYQMTDGTWTKIGNIKGATGEDGKDGEDGEDGQDLAAETVTLTFDTNGGELTDEEDNTVESYSIEVTKGDSVDLPVPVRDGYKFLGWYYGTGTNAGQVTDVTSITRDMTITAKWVRAYEMSLSYLDYTTMTESGYTNFEGYYESTFSTYGENNITIEIELDGEVYSLDEAINNGYIGDYYIYNSSSRFNGYIYFTAVGEYTVYLTYGYSSTSFDVTVNAYVFTGSVYVSGVSYYNYYYGYGSTTTTTSISDVNSTVYYNMGIYFHAPSDAEVSVTLGDNSVDYGYEWSLGTYTIYFTPKAFVGNTIGTYTFVVTVSSETYGSATATINYTLEQAPDFYYTYEPSSNLRINYSTNFELYYYGDCTYDYPVVTISDGTNTNTINCTEGWNYRTITDDNGEVLYCEFYFNGSNYISGNFCFYAVGNYTITINFGEDSDSFEIAVTNFESNVENTEIYTDNYSYFYVNYYGDSEYDYPEIAITSTEGYSYTYSITGTFGYGADDSTEDTDATTYLRAYWYGGSYMEDYIYFYAAGTYTVTISFGEDSVSYTVTVTDYVFDGETALEYIYWDGTSISNNAEITEYASEGYELGLIFDAPADYVVTVAIDGEEIEIYNSYNDWNYGTLYLYIYPLQLVDYTAGKYTLTVTVSSENNGSATATFSYVVEETPAYVDCIYIYDYDGIGDYSISEGIAAQYTNAIPASFSGNTIVVCIYAENAEITVTLEGTELTQDEDWYLEQSGNWYYVYIYSSVLETNELNDFVFEGINGKGTTNTIVVTAEGDNGTATATLSIITAIWVYYEYTSEEVAENGYFYLEAEYCEETEDVITITIESADGYTYTYTLSDGENVLEDDQEEVVTYIEVYVSSGSTDLNAYKEVYGRVYFNIAGEYTVTVSCGSSSIVVVEPYDYEGVYFGSVTYSSDSGETSYSKALTEAEEEITISGTTLVTYYFIPAENGTITITTIGSIDTYGYLYLDGICIEENDDYSSTNFLISYNVTAGTLYEIRVRGYSSGTSGTATLSISGVTFVYGASSDISLPEDEDIVITDYVDGNDNEMCLTFRAAKDFTVTIKVDGVEIDSEEIVSYTWNMGKLTVYVSPKLCTGTTAGEYTIEIIVSSETYSCSDSAVINYNIIAE